MTCIPRSLSRTKSEVFVFLSKVSKVFKEFTANFRSMQVQPRSSRNTLWNIITSCGCELPGMLMASNAVADMTDRSNLLRHSQYLWDQPICQRHQETLAQHLLYKHMCLTSLNDTKSGSWPPQSSVQTRVQLKFLLSSVEIVQEIVPAQ